MLHKPLSLTVYYNRKYLKEYDNCRLKSINCNNHNSTMDLSGYTMHYQRFFI